MGEIRCYEPSSLIESIHKNVPFLTDREPGESSSELVLSLGDGTRAFYDYFVVSPIPPRCPIAYSCSGIQPPLSIHVYGI